jgi:nitrate reductase NapA
MSPTRRDFLVQAANFYALSVAGVHLFPGNDLYAGMLGEDFLADKAVNWDKGVCRFCGTGCGVMIGVKDGKVVAVAGDKKNEVNKGFLCVKGYHLPSILYGEDRLKYPMIKRNGQMKKASWDEALDLIAKRFKQEGPKRVAFYGSGQWTIQDGYAALKFIKGGLGTNNIEANARLCMASAVAGFMTSFGKDEPMGVYDDFEATDNLVMWGNNMAECHPVLFSRITDHKRKNPHVKIIDVATRRTQTTAHADLYLEMRPQSDLAIANAICLEIIKQGKVNKEFVDRHAIFKEGSTNIGWGLEGEKAPKITGKIVSFSRYYDFLKTYTLKHAEKISGVPAAKIKQLADIYADPKQKVVSLWCMGVNQHSRGTWMNNLLNNIHLLTGKISQPGNNPTSLTGQPSACGTVREVGTLTHLLPGGRGVKNAQHRAEVEKHWGVKPGTIPAKPSMHTMAMFRKLKDGDLGAMWIQVTNPLVSLPDKDKFLEGIKKHKPFMVVSEVYPTPTSDIADVILPSSMWVEREACFGNSERRTQQWNKLVNPPGEAMTDSWQIIEVARRMGLGHLFPWKTEEEQAEGLYQEYRELTLGRGKDVADYNDLKKARGMRWPVVDGKETKWRYAEGHDPYVKKGEGFSFYGNKKHDNKAVIWLRPYEPAAEPPDKQYPFWLCTGRVVEHWHTGTMTRRVKELHQAVPKTYVELNSEDARELSIGHGNMVKLTTRRGSMVLPASIKERGNPSRGSVFVPFFDEGKIINALTLDNYCPISKEPDYKKCAVKIEKA